MSVFRLDGIADPADRKRVTRQAHHLTRWTSLAKILLVAIGGLVLAFILALMEQWRHLGPVFRNNEDAGRILIFSITYGGVVFLGQLWRISAERKALKFVLALDQRCTNCGYPMVGLNEKNCPECGGAVARL